MTFEYKPHPERLAARLDSPVDPSRCKAGVHDDRRWRTHQCLRSATVDGWCRQHHPDTVAQRRKERQEANQKAWENSPTMRADRAEKRVHELEQQLEVAIRQRGEERARAQALAAEVLLERARTVKAQDRVEALEAALREALSLAASNAEQQAMPDDSWVADHDRLKSILEGGAS